MLWTVVSGAVTLPAFAEDLFEHPKPSEILRFSDSISKLEVDAATAYANRDFKKAVDLLSELIYQQPMQARWSEMRAQVLVDGKNFSSAIMDYNEALQRTEGADTVGKARLTAGRALALEGIGDFKNARLDYRSAQTMALDAGEAYDPYIVNSIGNCEASLGNWSEAREAYVFAGKLFQGAKGLRGSNGSTTQRVDGAIFAQSNAALALVQVGDLPTAQKELEYVARRGPGSVDARVALAALYFKQERMDAAEEMWEYACDRITTGCSKYRDKEWLLTVRRWPPALVTMLFDFLALRAPAGDPEVPSTAKKEPEASPAET